MDVIFAYLQENRMVLVVIIAAIAWGFYRLTARPTAEMKNHGAVPAHVRYDRRESEQGDRRLANVLPAGHAERRKARRRA